MFNDERNFFTWVLNDEVPIPGQLMPVGVDPLVGRRSGFAFWVDEAHDNRNVLAAIRGQDATRNDYYNGPFDQLADSQADDTNIADYVIEASPSLQGRIDGRPYRQVGLLHRQRAAFAGFHLYLLLRFASRRGVLPTPVPGTTGP